MLNKIEQLYKGDKQNPYIFKGLLKVLLVIWLGNRTDIVRILLHLLTMNSNDKY